MEIIIDKRIELMTIIQTLCGYWDNLSIKSTNKYLHQSRYKKNVQEHFEKYRKHKIIELYSVLCNDITDISFFLNMALCYSDPPELDNTANFEINFDEISRMIFPYEEFINELRDFYFNTDYERFFQNNQSEYDQILNNYGNIIKLKTHLISDYLDAKTENYTVIISPMIFGNFNIKINTHENRILHYSLISPFDYKDELYNFGSLNLKKSIIWHEIGHLTINDLTKNHITHFKINEKEIPEIFIRNFYTNIETIINEYIIRAITIRVFEINGESDFIRSLMELSIQNGFKNIETIKKYIEKHFEENNKLIKDNRYKELIEYIIRNIKKSKE